uniref:ATP-dependent helicase C-terminal domain-containing protein n=1 Tax=Panagrolaimus sp. JU765 TaxID=591449 RepID=A0AC34QBG6_9BILA
EAIEMAKKANLLSRIQTFCRSKEYNEVKTEALSNTASTSSSALKNFLERAKNRGANEDQKLNNARTEPSPQPAPAVPESFPLFNLAEFFINLGIAGDNFQVIVDVASNPRKYQLLCLNGGERFNSIVTAARSTVLIGGTMKPAELVISLLTKDCGIPRQRIVVNSYDHIIDANNLRIATVVADNHGPLTFTHSTMKEKNIFGRILDSLAHLFEKVPNGLVVFFPSKAFLNSFLTAIRSENSKNFQALKFRSFYVEGSDENVWEKYSKKAKREKTTFFAVIGGKFSEGVNFSDELARCVVIVGLPYPNTMNSEFK